MEEDDLHAGAPVVVQVQLERDLEEDEEVRDLSFRFVSFRERENGANMIYEHKTVCKF